MRVHRACQIAVLACIWTAASFGKVAQIETVNVVATNYDLRLQVDPEHKTFDADARVSFRNEGNTPLRRLTLMLYRLLHVQKALNANGGALSFRQQVISMSGEENWQVNEVTLDLPTPVPARGTSEIQLYYRGTIAGYPEVMQYVKDTIDERYALFRAESLPYPILGSGVENWRRIYRSPFTFNVRVQVPKGYTVVCGGTPAGRTETAGWAVFTCSAPKPQSQLNVAVAKFVVAEDSANQLRVYSLPEDAAAGVRVLSELKRALDFYTGYFGPRSSGTGMNVIEIPDGWGSYTGEGFIFQSAAAFKDAKQNVELYHEVAHRWNALADPQIQRCRWFDEAFASYFEALALRSLSGEQAYRDDLQRARKHFTRAAGKEPKAASVPIAEYGKNEMGGYSYTKGAWSLYVLHQVLGEEAFRHSIAQFLKEYESKPAGFAEFRRVVEQVSGRDLGRYFDEWIFGVESSRLLLSDETVDRMAQRYLTSASAPSEPAKSK